MSWAALPHDLQLAIGWRVVGRLFAFVDGEPIDWRAGEAIELVDKFFHALARDAVLALASIQCVHKDQAVADLFSKSVVSLAIRCIDDLRGPDRAVHLMNLKSSAFSMVYARFCGFKQLRVDDPLFTAADKIELGRRHRRFGLHIQCAVCAADPSAEPFREMLREAVQADARRAAPLQSFAMAVFGQAGFSSAGVLEVA